MKELGYILVIIGTIGLLALTIYITFKIHVVLGIGFALFTMILIGSALAEYNPNDIYKKY